MDPRPSAASQQPFLTVRSRLPPLYPGFSGVFEVLVTSPASAPGTVAIAAIVVHVDDASASCRASNLSIPGYRAAAGTSTYTVAPGHTVVVPLAIAMPDTGLDQNGCQGVTFRVHYTALSAASTGAR
jgi:hypothetical protein